jgi:hypothetical protein
VKCRTGRTIGCSALFLADEHNAIADSKHHMRDAVVCRHDIVELGGGTGRIVPRVQDLAPEQRVVHGYQTAGREQRDGGLVVRWVAGFVGVDEDELDRFLALVALKSGVR